MLRPITLFPFPKKVINNLAQNIKSMLVVEMNNGQMLEDVQLAVKGQSTVDFYNRMGGVVPNTDEIVQQIKNRFDN